MNFKDSQRATSSSNYLYQHYGTRGDGFNGDHDLVLCFAKWKRFVDILTLGEIPK